MAKSKTYEMLLKIAGKADGSLKAACSAAEKDLATLGDAAKAAGTVAATALAGIATAAAGVAASSLSAYSEFEQAMDSTAVTARATEEEYALMEAAARQMGATTTKTATEAAEAMGYMALAGWDVEESMAGLEPILRASEATGMDLARCSDLVTDSMSALGLGVGDMTDYLDLAVQAQRASNTTAESLLEAFIGCGGAAKTAGVDMGDLSTALGVLANNGTKGSEAGTALNSMLSRMTTNSAALSAFEDLGVAVFDSAGNFRGLETVLGDTSAALSTLSDAERLAYMKNIAGTNYFTEMSYLLDAVADGADGAASAWSTLETDIMDHSGVLLEVAKANTDNLAGATAIFQSAVSELQLQIGEQLAPYAKEGLEYLANNVLPTVSEKLAEIIPQVIETAKVLWEHKDVILAIAAGIGTAIAAYKAAKIGMAAYNAAMAIYQIVTAASATGTFTLAGAMTALNIPMLATVAAIGAVVAIAILLVKNWDKVKAAGLAAWEKIKEIWGGVADWFNAKVIKPLTAFFSPIVAFFSELFRSIFDDIKNVWASICGVFSAAWELIKAVWNVVEPFFAGVWGGIKAVFSVVTSILGGFFKTAWAAIQAVWSVSVEWFKLIWSGIKAVFSVVVAVLSGFFKTAWEAIKAVWNTVTAYFQAIFNTIAGIFSVVSAVLSGDFSAAWEAIKGIVGTWAAYFGTVWEGIKAVFGAVASWFGGVFSAAWEAIKSVFAAVGEFFQGVWNTIVSLFTSIGTAVGDAISGAVKGAINAVLSGAIGIINGFISAINVAIGVINAIPGVKIAALKPLEIPQLATGGIVTAPTILEAGEGGEPEAVLPLSKLSAMLQDEPEEAPLAQLAKMLDDWTRNNKPGPQTPGQGGAGATDYPEPQGGGGNESPPPEGGQNPQGGGVDTITFAPVFNFYGPTTPEQAKEAGQISFAEFKRLYQQMKAEERRKNLRAPTH